VPAGKPAVAVAAPKTEKLPETEVQNAPATNKAEEATPAKAEAAPEKAAEPEKTAEPEKAAEIVPESPEVILYRRKVQNLLVLISALLSGGLGAGSDKK
jgi:hypothetical protein